LSNIGIRIVTVVVEINIKMLQWASFKYPSLTKGELKNTEYCRYSQIFTQDIDIFLTNLSLPYLTLPIKIGTIAKI